MINMIPDKNFLKELDDKNIEKFKDVDYDDPDSNNIEFTCLSCGAPVTTFDSCSIEGHNLICNICVNGLTEQRHMAQSFGYFVIKFIHTHTNIWDVLPIDCFEHV